MDRDYIFDKVVETIAEQIGADRDEMDESTSFQDDLKIDSLDLLQIVTAIEDEFDVTVAGNDFAAVGTIGEAVGYLEKLVS